MSSSRRYFLKNAGAFALGFTGLHTLAGRAALSAWDAWRPPDGFGPLLPDPDGVLDLPKDFSYQIISRAGGRMTDGFFVPAAADGMAAFPGPDESGQTLLVRNHEVSTFEPGEGAFGPTGDLQRRLDRSAFYDAGQQPRRPCLGGTTTLVYDTRAGRLAGQHLSLAGTVRNCAGGPTPWNTWISCEETTIRTGAGYAKDHGFNFEVPASSTPGLAEPVPLKAMGRFNHEAVAVDPASGIVYETEDAGDSLIYRYLPKAPGDLAKGGRLQALAAVEQERLDTRNWGAGPLIQPGTTFTARWIDLDHVLAPDDDLRLRGFEQGAARFARGEGMWYGNGAVYFACTNGGFKEKGQIWRYVPSPYEGTAREKDQPGTLELFVEPNDGDVVDNGDNVTVAPWGDLILCEDGSGEQYLSGVTPQGNFYKFARNAVTNSEFAGSTFSPDGTTLFVNIQEPGLTLAITGPWNARRG